MERAEYKLRQADLLLAYLRELPKEIAADMRRAAYDETHHKLALETFFHACLGAAKSADYLLRKSPSFVTIRSEFWDRSSVESARFRAMADLRDRDVHHGDVETDALTTMIPGEDHGSPFGQYLHPGHGRLRSPRTRIQTAEVVSAPTAE